MTYTLYAALQKLNLKPTTTLAYCTFTVNLTSSNAGIILAFSDYSGTNANSVEAKVSYSRMYSRSLLGAKQAIFTYSWAKSSTYTLQFDLTIVDNCASKVHPGGPFSLSYILMTNQQNVNVAAAIDTTLCTYDIELVSVMASGTDYKTNSLWIWSGANDVRQSDAVNFGAF